MKKNVFIVPYFGKLPKTFPVFLKSCVANTDFEWLIFTDDKTSYEYPPNVKRILMTFEELKNRVQSKFEFPIRLERPYKLCDYKPAYGLIFEDYLQDYLFWGHCDIDTVMGKLDDFITEELLDSYDKLFCLGHMILYRNTYENNRAFMTETNGRYLYKESFTTDKITVFDETYGGRDNVNTVFLEAGKRVFMADWSVNFKILPTSFLRTRFNAEKYAYDIFPNEKNLYVWSKGKLLRYYLEDNEVKAKEEMYIHFQSRNMRYQPGVLSCSAFKMVPNRYCVLKRDIKTVWDFRIESIFISFHFFEIKYKRLVKRIKSKPRLVKK